MEAASKQIEERNALEEREATPEPVSTPEPAAEPVAEVEAAPEPTPEAEKSPLERARDEAGKFAKGSAKVVPAVVKPKVEPTEGAPEALAAPGAETPPPAPPVPALKAPQSWKPSVREAWSKVPPEVQQEVLRRDAEINRTLQETAEARKGMDQVRQTLAPYESLARANGMDTMKYAGSVLQTAAALSMGSKTQKAHVLATLIQSYAVDVDEINAVMQGQAPQGPQQAPQPDIDSLVDKALQARLHRVESDKAARAWAEFEATAPEFLNDVKDQMILVLNDVERRGGNMTYPQAYASACKLNEEVAATLSQRKAAQAVRTPGTVTPATRAAASSVRSSPGAPQAPNPKSIHAAMAAAAEKLGM
jgi:hypothetical protein